jgi:hypothetical protein
MKKMSICVVLVFFFTAGWVAIPQHTQAALEWRTIKNVDLKTEPLDISPSTDGQWLFILTPGEILVYSVSEEKITDRIPVDKDFDRITASHGANTLTITSSTKKTLQIIQLEYIQEIDITGHPFKGPEDAPVTVAVFTDYQ